MSNDIVIEQRNTAPAVSNESNALLVMIERLVLNPDADIDKLSKMLDLQERVLNRNAEQAFASDFAAMQSELPRVEKNGLIEIKDRSTGRVTQSTPFAKLEDINDKVRPVLQKYGFGVSFSIDQSAAGITVTAKLRHRLGHSDTTSITLPIDASGSKNAVQGNVSTVSYGKRVTITAILNISTGDDTDGNLPQQEDDSGFVSSTQVVALINAIAMAGLTQEQFCKNKAVNIESVEMLPAQRFDGAIAFLKARATK